MMILKRQSFMDEYYNNSDKNIKLYQYKLSEQTIEDYEINTFDIETFELTSSPTLGYYEFSGIISGTDLQISLRPPDSDFSVERYKSILVYCEDVETSQVSPAFLIKLSDDEILRRAVNIIDIPEFNPKSKVSYSQSIDTTRLEGEGQGRSKNLLELTEKNIQAYITRESWVAYKQLIRSTDAQIEGFFPLDHLDTVRINEFGLKIY